MDLPFTHLQSYPLPPTFNHSLNPEKQMGKLLSNTETPSVEFDVLDEGTCVTMKCNVGFFIKVAKPTFYGLSQGSYHNLSNHGVYASAGCIRS